MCCDAADDHGCVSRAHAVGIEHLLGEWLALMCCVTKDGLERALVVSIHGECSRLQGTQRSKLRSVVAFSC